MRRIVYGVGMSLDGYIARPDGSVDFLFMPKDYSMAAFFKRVDVSLMGRKTYDVSLKLSGGKFDSYGMGCYVFSRTMPAGQQGPITVVAEPLKKFINELRKKKGKDIWLMGGGELTRDFLREDLVDELYLGVLPVMIGEGIPAFPAGFPQRDFTLVENKSYSRGMIALRYERKRARAGKAKKR